MSTNSHKYWSFLVYPESAISDWRQKIVERGLAFAVSPLHEYDVTSEGQLKKPHHHVLIPYPNSTTFNNVKNLTVDELRCTIPKPIDNISGAYDYLTHKRNPEKFQYDENLIELWNGFDINELITLSERDRDELFSSIELEIERYNIKEYRELLMFYTIHEDYARKNFVRSHTFHFKGYLESSRHSSNSHIVDEYYKKFNIETFEE
ncbi:MAG: replication protein [Ruminococcus sp.]|nr:replication protein [Ruminococcus sp.]